jgi:NADPH:quinone reductase-like Zn-dependent oxidoreductase
MDRLKPASKERRETMATMTAIRFHSYGGPEVLVQEDAPRPEAAAGEVLIRVHAAGVNPLDWKVRAGYVKEWLPHRLPLIPGWDVSGVVESVGVGSTDLNVGDEVYGLLDFTRDGAYAEYVAARARDMALKPSSLDHVQAAALPIAALTAWQALFDVANLSAGQTVLIHGAAGGVGHYAVQLAKWKGARVIGTASARNMNFVRELGADKVIDYQTTRFNEAVSDVNVVLDTQGGETQLHSWKVMKMGGILVSTVGISSPETPSALGVRGEPVLVHPDANQLTEIAALIDLGELKPLINSVVPLAEAAKAHELSQAGHVRGKIVLKIRD